ncbi:DNA topoisomerase 2-binding protein 1 [Bienertia sinuspersici]
MNSKPFKGSNVFMSRNLVPPEIFDSLIDALNLNGANVFHCCDPSRNSSDDFHVISSPQHVWISHSSSLFCSILEFIFLILFFRYEILQEKFEDLRAKGCNLLGPQCILSCAKERRVLPKLGFVCCLAMDGVKVLASGFGAEEREKIGKLVIAMSGSFHTKPSSDVSFVVVKDVLATKNKLKAKSSQEKCTMKSQSVLSSAATDPSLQAVSSVGITDSDLDVAYSQNLSSACQSDSAFVKEKDTGQPDPPANDKAGFVAEDSETDDNDLYLSDCRICLVGFSALDMRKLVGMVRRGGGSRYMTCSERLTHIVVGEPSDVEKRKLRGLAAHGVIRLVRWNWLEDCDREKREVPVMQKHIAYNLLLSKDLSGLSSKAPVAGMGSSKQAENLNMLFKSSIASTSGTVDTVTEMSLEKSSHSVEKSQSSPRRVKLSALNGNNTSQKKIQRGDKLQSVKSINVFVGKCFCFSHSFPDDRRDEVVQWINEGGGEVVADHVTIDVDYTVECHGVTTRSTSTSQTTYVSSHWIRSCLEDGRLLEADSHILYSPLQCSVPLPGFAGLRFCVSQYTDKERLLLRNLCFVLGARFAEKLTRKVTHLLCKFTNGPKYEAACKWGIYTVRCEWLYECVKKNGIVSLDDFHPEEVPQVPESGVCTGTQYPMQAAKLISMENSSQLSSQSQDLRNSNTQQSSKRKRLESGMRPDQEAQIHKTSVAVELHDDTKENGHSVPDVAAAIEDLLEQTSKLFSSDCPILARDDTAPHPAFEPSKHWLNSLGKDNQDVSRDQSTGVHDPFSETQTESVGYEDDLSGRQEIINRVRTRSSMT